MLRFAAVSPKPHHHSAKPATMSGATTSGSPTQPFWARVLTLTAVAAFGCALLGALGAWATISGTPQRYEAAAIFHIARRPTGAPLVSHSRSVQAEQTARELRHGRAAAIATSAVENARNSHALNAVWTAGPNNGELSYRVQAASETAANRAATAVYREAGEHGAGLLNPGGRHIHVTRSKVSAAKAVYRRQITTVVASGAVAGACGGIVALVALRGRGRQRSASIAGPRSTGE